jgi:CRP-like cAMP-binding protein
MSNEKVNIELLRATPIFSTLSDNELKMVLDAPENCIEEYEPKKLVIRESELGNCMYIILEGYAEVLIRSGSGNRDISIATLRPGDFFGEKALMADGTGRRNASIRTIRDTKVFKIDKKYALMGIKRDSEHLDEDDEDEITQINFNLPPDEVRDTITKIRIFKSLNKNEVFTLDDDGKIVILANLSHGDYFGEQALMPDSRGKRNAFARTDTKSKLIKIPKDYFRLILNRDSTLYQELKKTHEMQNKQRHDIS